MQHKKLIPLYYAILLSAIIFFVLIIWTLPALERLGERIRMLRSGLVMYKPSYEFTISSLIIFILIRLVIIGSAILLIIKRNIFSIGFFIIMFFPVLIEIVRVLVPVIDIALKEVGLEGTLKMVYKESICLLLIVLIFVSLIKIIIQKRWYTINILNIIMFFFSLIVMFFIYNSFELYF